MVHRHNMASSSAKPLQVSHACWLNSVDWLFALKVCPGPGTDPSEYASFMHNMLIQNQGNWPVHCIPVGRSSAEQDSNEDTRRCRLGWQEAPSTHVPAV